MNLCHWSTVILTIWACMGQPAAARPIELNERSAQFDQWGYRPADGDTSATDPPSFSWLPQKSLTWEIQCASDTAFKDVVYQKAGLEFNVHCPPVTFGPGTYTWRYRGRDAQGNETSWSRSRTVTITIEATKMPLPERDVLLSRIPKAHPRLFLRPENLPKLRELARVSMKAEYDKLV